MNELPLHTPVFIWGRPETDLILLFGEGTFEGFNHFNGNNWPVVRTADGREFTIHYQGVYVGEKGSVERTCKQFKGDIVEFDLQSYLAGQRPTRNQAAVSANGVSKLPEPKTATDRLFYLKREIAIELSKIELHQRAITESQNAIEKKRAEMAAIKGEVLKELSTLDDVPPEVILAAAEKIKAEQQQRGHPPRVEVNENADYNKLAVED